MHFGQLMKYNKWDYVVGEIACAFDVNPDRQGVRCIPVYDIADLRRRCRWLPYRNSGDF